MLNMVSAGGSQATSKQENTSQPLGRQDTTRSEYMAKAPPLCCVRRERQGWLPSISAVYVGNVRTEMLGQEIRKPWGHWHEALGGSVNKVHSRPGAMWVG